MGDTMPQRARALTAPLLVVHGAEDRLVPAPGSERLVECARLDRRPSEGLSGLYHEVSTGPSVSAFSTTSGVDRGQTVKRRHRSPLDCTLTVTTALPSRLRPGAP